MPSSSIVASIGPRPRVARSTATGCGRSAQNRAAPMARTTSAARMRFSHLSATGHSRVLRTRTRSSRVDPAADDEGRDQRGAGHHEARYGEDVRLDLEGNAKEVAGDALGDEVADRRPEGPADRLGERDDHAGLDEQDLRHLAAPEAEHAERGELPRPLGELDAGAVVDHAEGDDDGQREVDGRS